MSKKDKKSKKRSAVKKHGSKQAGSAVDAIFSDPTTWLKGAPVADTKKTKKPKGKKKFKTPATMPTPYQAELLVILMEEAAEVQHRAAKLLRFGADEVQPKQKLTNAQRLSEEIGDLYYMVGELEDVGIVSSSRMTLAMERKGKKLERYMQNFETPPKE